MPYRTLAKFVGIFAIVALTGCGQTEPPAFRLDMVKVTENEISPKHQQAIADILGAMFGTPDAPFAMPETGLDERKLKMAAGPVWSNEAGDKHGLYRRHCAHCHGISGDGQGPTAAILNPYPRDYRRGLFKFKGTFTAAQPTDEDLRRIILNGVLATAMPAFALLPPDEVDALVEYVKYLSMRGQMETALENYVFDEGLEPDAPLDPATDAELKDIIVNDLLAGVMEGWNTVVEQVVVPTEEGIPPTDRSAEEITASVNAGRELFFGAKANCVKCHGPTGLGDGQQDNYDDWSAVTVKFEDDTRALADEIKGLKQDLKKKTGDERAAAEKELKTKVAQLAVRNELIAHMLTPRRAIPRNLRDGTYRGGRRDIDLFWRVFAGIPGMGMPATGPSAPGGQGTLTEQEMWQIVDYIQSLPFEPISEPQVRRVNVRTVN
ncbi:MAG: cytochrome c [Planctomycetes bacterium]|nr:cytochrome c [Planctomycetota bacterium]